LRRNKNLVFFVSLGGEKKMKTKSLAIILVLAMLILTAGPVYPGRVPTRSKFGPPVKAHPWEDLNNNNGPSGCSAVFPQEDRKVIEIRIFSDFFIWIHIKDMPKRSDHQRNSTRTDVRSYQIIFPW
jgi:hypothetical protein